MTPGGRKIKPCGEEYSLLFAGPHDSEFAFHDGSPSRFVLRTAVPLLLWHLSLPRTTLRRYVEGWWMYNAP